ncbi:hypothetical protein NC652_029599 [Populus alba x Populus x berolinensis]|nr:hypothetical protein NC652_029599 [Populus alba x Populus x berolinensis]
MATYNPEFYDTIRRFCRRSFICRGKNHERIVANTVQLEAETYAVKGLHLQLTVTVYDYSLAI